MFTWLLRIPNTSIYMSFKVAQDHNKAAGRDTTLLTPSSTRWEDLTTTTWRRSSYFAFICRSFDFGFAYRELYCLKVVELVLFLLVVNYVVDLMMCVNYIGAVWFIRGASKTGCRKNKNSYIHQLADDYKGHTSASGRLRGPIYSSVNR
jgi:hypothetical protein